MKIFDCFQYFDEDMILDLRLNILDRYVDHFIIVENLFMHSGKKKKKNFDINKFKKFKKKIIYILVDKLPEGLYDINSFSEKEKTNRTIDNSLKIEHNQRNKILSGLEEAHNDDLILISDIDEIPNLENIKSKIENKIILFRQKIFYYKFNLSYNSVPWIGTKATKKINLISPQWLRDLKNRKYPFWRLDIIFDKMKYSNIQFIENGGWHFTNFRTPKELELKLNNYGHHAEFKESGLTLTDIKKMMKENKVVYDLGVDMRTSKWAGKQKLEKTTIDQLPDYVQANYALYKDWFI
jgi:beta-1,4-mannosyl-glycoprotein beta-1,4-N-acetylglucosaminyltransferase|tara:strand:- start:170 stop:1054 length:885 start_codon:yes stop_codon:yes gene_type:complete